MTFSATCSGLLCVTISEALSELERQKKYKFLTQESQILKNAGEDFLIYHKYQVFWLLQDKRRIIL